MTGEADTAPPAVGGTYRHWKNGHDYVVASIGTYVDGSREGMGCVVYHRSGFPHEVFVRSLHDWTSQPVQGVSRFRRLDV